jgi:hypothetical protein
MYVPWYVVHNIIIMSNESIGSVRPPTVCPPGGIARVRSGGEHFAICWNMTTLLAGIHVVLVEADSIPSPRCIMHDTSSPGFDHSSSYAGIHH